MLAQRVPYFWTGHWRLVVWHFFRCSSLGLYGGENDGKTGQGVTSWCRLLCGRWPGMVFLGGGSRSTNCGRWLENRVLRTGTFVRSQEFWPGLAKGNNTVPKPGGIYSLRGRRAVFYHYCVFLTRSGVKNDREQSSPGDGMLLCLVRWYTSSLIRPLWCAKDCTCFFLVRNENSVTFSECYLKAFSAMK